MGDVQVAYPIFITFCNFKIVQSTCVALIYKKLAQEVKRILEP